MILVGLSNGSGSAETVALAFLLSDPSVKASFLQNHAWTGSLLASSVFLGGFLGYLVVGSMGDVFGRRALILHGLTITSGAGLASGLLSVDIFSLSFFRFLVGIGIGAMSPALVSMASEIAPPSSRGFWIAAVMTFWSIGAIYTSVVAWITLGPGSHALLIGRWRWFLVWCSLPCAVAMVMAWAFVVESPRFLISKDNYDDATASLRTLSHQMQFDGKPMTSNELRLSHPPLPVPPSALSTTTTSASDSQDTKDASRTVWSIMKSRTEELVESCKVLYGREYLPTTIPLTLVWFMLCFGFNGIASWITRLFQSVHLSSLYFDTFLFSVAQLPGALLSFVLLDRMSREKVLAVGFTMSALALVVFAYYASIGATGQHAQAQDNAHRTWGVVGSACVFQMGMQMAWNTISVVTTERYPTTVRASAWGVYQSIGKIASVVATSVNGFLILWSAIGLLLLAGSAMAIAAVSALSLPKLDLSKGLDQTIVVVATTEGRDLNNTAVDEGAYNADQSSPTDSSMLFVDHEDKALLSSSSPLKGYNTIVE